MAEALEDAVEAKDKRVALIIAILALFLALAEAGGKNAEHRSTEQNIEASDLYNFYQAKKIRTSVIEADIAQMEFARQAATDPNVQAAADKQIGAWKSLITRLETEKPDGMEAIQERAKEAAEGRELSNHRLEHYEYASGLIQIAIVLASAAIITGIATLMWLSVGLGVIGAALMALGYFSPTLLPFLG
ncbi:DUF4337 domain-containing protein [Methylocapsa sp. S129]|uniref:DUF4337 domain-containing protein n=1 Tax=Methylocapsa sp. S129 TaxID=1641869 RepID=UPI00131B1A59|nr:DUF4337 domain-containing protein [Methylocapsa sp. S129]